MTPASGIPSGLRSVPNPLLPSATPRSGDMYLAKAPHMPHRLSGKSSVLPSKEQPLRQLEPIAPKVPKKSKLVLPSSFPKPPPIAMPAMQQPPKFTPVAEPAWERERRGEQGKSEAERFKESILNGTTGIAQDNGLQTEDPSRLKGNGAPKKKKKKKARPSAEPPVELERTTSITVIQPAVPHNVLQPPLPPQDVYIPPTATHEVVEEDTNGVATNDTPAGQAVTEEDDEALLQRQRREARRRRRRTMRSAMTGADSAGGDRARLLRGASMRRRNIWDGESLYLAQHFFYKPIADHC